MRSITSKGRARRAAMLAMFLVIACGDGPATYPIEDIREARPAILEPGAKATTAQRFRMRRRGAPDDGHSQRRLYAWELPEGWKELPPTKHRQVNFTLERDRSAECYLSVLPGGGGGVLANIDRWRRQMGLPPTDAGAIAKLPREVLFGREAALVDLKGDFVGMGSAAKAKSDYRLLGLVVETQGTALFFKFVGPAALVEPEREHFLALAASLRLDKSHNADSAKKGAGGAQRQPASRGGLVWDVPEGWVVSPEKRGNRIVTLHVGADKQAECYIYPLGGDGGGLAGNINRWRDQTANKKLSAAEIAKLQRIPMLGDSAVVLESYGSFRGMSGEAVAESGLLGAYWNVGAQTLTVKLTGPEDVVRAEKSNFLAFCKSLRVGE